MGVLSRIFYMTLIIQVKWKKWKKEKEKKIKGRDK